MSRSRTVALWAHTGRSKPPVVATGGPAAANLAHHVAARAGRFTGEAHAARCLAIYQQVLDYGRLKTA
ncbi:hypothetical protein [Saccharopolyspora elongata]|uniref:hypothetical protein n=1 Tax=Saccharopolyspora elongata TaxID=2530387 RepID=UPI001404B30E|nr:hypothetical protein [Saccharopolyspora elongata]